MPQTKIGLYNLDDFEPLLTGSPLEVFLKGHLWLEKVLEDVLETAAENVEPLKLERMTFSAKVNLCEAFGLIPRPLCKAFREVNRRRNVLAHDLHASFGHDSLPAIVEHLPSQTRSVYEAMIATLGENAESAEHRLEFWFLAVVMETGHGILLRRWRNEYSSEHAAFAGVRAVEDMFKESPRSDEEIRKEVRLPAPPSPRDVFYRASRS